MLFYTHFSTPLGEMYLLSSETSLLSLEYRSAFMSEEELLKMWQSRFKDEVINQQTSILKTVIQQLQEYFEGNRQSFDLPLDLSVGTKFQQQVWQGLLTIPYGETLSYKTLAERIGRPKAIRALANANGCNPLSIIVPCHRVIYENGKLGGYSSGIDKKKFLLQIEKQNKS